MVNCKTIGLDIAKNTFFLVMLDEKGKETSRKKLSRKQMLTFFSNQPVCKIALEACASSHYWGRKFQKLGFEVELLPAQHVKGYLRGQKNDYNDAKAIAEASIHGAIRAVAVKSVEQQDEQTFLTMRGHLRHQKTCLINHIRGLLAEYGIVLVKGGNVLQKELPYILEDADNELTDFTRELLLQQKIMLDIIDNRLKSFEEQIAEKAKQDDVCKRLTEIPGKGSSIL